MHFKKQYICVTCTLLTVGMLVGCGAPDLNAMRPQVKKPACAVIIVDKPNFVSQSAFISANGTGNMVVNPVATTLSTFAKDTAKILQNRDVTSCIIAVDNGQLVSRDIARLEQQFGQINFTVLSNEALGLTSGTNGASITQDSSVQAFAIGWLAGVWANTLVQNQHLTQQPTFGFDAAGLTKDEEKAFFAGLFTTNPNASVQSITPISNTPANGTSNGKTNSTMNVPPTTGTSTWTPPPVVSAVILGQDPSQATSQIISSQTPVVFAIHALGSGVHAAVQPGRLDPSDFTRELTQVTTGHWQAGDETVMDPSSISINVSLVPSAVMSAWNTLQPTASSTVWKNDFNKLPTPTKQMLLSQFGIA